MVPSSPRLTAAEDFGSLKACRPKIFSFFSGSGFLDLGFEAEGYETVFVNENHTPFLKAYKYARDDQALKEALDLDDYKPLYSSSSIENLLDDPATDGLSKLVKEASKVRSVPFGFIGGPPCPDFSVGGKNRGKSGENGKLTETYVSLICNMQPDFFLLENVKGLIRTKKHREFFDQQISRLKRAGYSVRFDLLNSLSFEVPQDRHRVIVFGLRKKSVKNAERKISNFSWEKKFEPDAILSMPWPKTTDYSEGGSVPPPNNVLLHMTVGHWFNANDVQNHPNAQSHFQPRAALPKFQSVPEGDTDKKSYKRPHRWRYSPTAAYGNNEVHLHPWLPRRMSAAEALAIQSMPPEFSFPSDMSLSNMFKTIGNGVPVRLHIK